MKKRICLLIVLTIISVCTGQEKVVSNLILNKDSHEKILSLLPKQLEYGKPTYDNPYVYKDIDLDITTDITFEILKNSNYTFPKNDFFNNRIKKVFNRMIDSTSKAKYLYANFLNKCKYDKIYSPNNIIDYYGIFIVKNKNFITENFSIPEVIDYQKEYSKIASNEGKIPKTYKNEQGQIVAKYFWKDDPNLELNRLRNVSILISRNKYLFNDNRTDFKWLLENDEYFMRSLVTVYGYTDDEELLNWVIYKCKTDQKDDFEELTRIICNKSCTNKFVVNEKVIQIMTGDNTKGYSAFLYDYFERYFEMNIKELTIVEKAKLVAFVYNSGIKSKQKEYLNSIKKVKNNLDKNGGLTSEFEKNNYYDLVLLKEIWNKI